MVAAFNLGPSGAGTRVAWEGEAQVFGRLTSVAGGLLEPLGKKQVQKLIDGLQAALNGASGGTL
jgi:carbon monoxide dehydrogenase subunit G